MRSDNGCINFEWSDWALQKTDINRHHLNQQTDDLFEGETFLEGQIDTRQNLTDSCFEFLPSKIDRGVQSKDFSKESKDKSS